MYFYICLIWSIYAVHRHIKNNPDDNVSFKKSLFIFCINYIFFPFAVLYVIIKKIIW